ncbi:MAG: tetraacyldisaccharide 4'-kinase [Planctomycetota bacterium]
MDEATLHELLSGHRRDVGARLLRGGLHLASWGYGAAMSLRNIAYDREWLRTARVDVPVISLGNITTGGTGKTPLAAWLANWLTEAGRTPGLLSRGYRSLGKTAHLAERADHVGNDEKLVLDRLCPGVPHLQQRDRVSAARRLVSEQGCDTLILDDGFQHRRLHRDLDLVLIDALCPWGYGHLLPRGLLREPLSALRRADLVLLTRADQISPEQRGLLLDQLARVRGTDECVEIAFAPRHLIGLHGETLPLEAVPGRTVFAFCGIGNPHGFARTVSSLESVPSRSVSPSTQSQFSESVGDDEGRDAALWNRLRVFPDHHHYTERDLASVADTARQTDAEIVLTTLKDFVKLRPGAWHGPPLYAIEVGVEFFSGRGLMESRLQQLSRLHHRAA